MRQALRSRVIRRFAAVQFLLEVQFWFPVYLIYVLDLGFSLAVAVLADGVFRLVSVLCEVPMGILADRIGRRRTYLLLTGLAVATFTAITQIQTVQGLFGAWILWGVLWALGSGASSAYLYELAAREAPTVDAHRAFGLVRAVEQVAVLVSLLAAGYLYGVAPALPFAVTAALAAIAFVVAWTLPETADTQVRSTFRSVMRDIRTTAADRRVRLVVALGALLLLLGWSPRILLQPLALDLDYSVQRTGWMYAAFAAAAVVAGVVAGRVGPGGRRAVLRTSFLLLLAMLLATSSFPWLGPFLFLPVLGFAYTLGLTVLEFATNEATTPRLRATVLSVVSLLGGVGIAVARPSLGIASDRLSVATAFSLWAGIGALLVLAALVLLRRLDAGDEHRRGDEQARIGA
jgi:MFS family permease